MSEQDEIHDAIAEYSRAYARLEALQRPLGLLPKGDQKTGCIGEFYARLYLDGSESGISVTPGNHSNKAWDFDARARGRKRLIQVKTVSAYSKRELSLIHRGCDELWVISLDTQFKPSGFWIVKKKNLQALRFPIKGARAPGPEATARSSRGLVFGPNRVSELQKHIEGRSEGRASLA